MRARVFDQNLESIYFSTNVVNIVIVEVYQSVILNQFRLCNYYNRSIDSDFNFLLKYLKIPRRIRDERARETFLKSIFSKT